MRYTLFILTFFLFSQILKSQAPEISDVISINTKFKLELIKIDSIDYVYKIVSKEPLNGELDSDSARLQISDSLSINEVQGIFGYGNFGNSKSTMLIVKSGNDSPLNYNLFIDIKGKGKFVNTSTVPIHDGIPSLEIWPEYIYSIKISGFSKVDIKPSEDELDLDTTCTSEFDIDKGNILFDEQLGLISDIIFHQANFELDRIKEYEDSIMSIPASSWGWGNELNILDSNGRLTGTYINRRKIAQPLVFTLTECPYLEREVAYFFSKKRKDVKFVVFKWSQRWDGGWQSRAYHEIECDFKSKYEYIRNSLNKTLGSPGDSLTEDNRRFQTKWQTKEGVIAKSYLYMDQYARYLKLYIYLKDE
jgi:hypothetical protein